MRPKGFIFKDFLDCSLLLCILNCFLFFVIFVEKILQLCSVGSFFFLLFFLFTKNAFLDFFLVFFFCLRFFSFFF